MRSLRCNRCGDELHAEEHDYCGRCLDYNDDARQREQDQIDKENDLAEARRKR